MSQTTPVIGFIPKRAPVTDDNYPSATSFEQTRTENSCKQLMSGWQNLPKPARKNLKLLRHQHVPWLLRGLRHLSAGMSNLDCSRVWILFWILHALELLGWEITEHEKQPGYDKLGCPTSSQMVAWVRRCFWSSAEQTDIHKSKKTTTTEQQQPQTEEEEYGGYGGGPNQFPHLAPTYAAVAALCIIGTEEAYNSIPIKPLRRWMQKLKTAENSFRMHIDGEVDIRATYCCLATASLLNIIDDKLTSGVASYLFRCQTFEGGFGCEPYDEAHGGYTFCGTAALSILGELQNCNQHTLLKWVTSRQMRLEGGLSGRANKLVDSCYTYWVGACYAIIEGMLAVDRQEKNNNLVRDIFILDYLQLTNANAPTTTTTLDGETTTTTTQTPTPSNDQPPPAEIVEPNQGSATSSPPSKEQDQAEVVDSSLTDDDGEFVDVEDLWTAGGDMQGDFLFDSECIQEYVLLCCQQAHGGLRDKPGKSADYYHSCYSLSGLAISQNTHYAYHARNPGGNPLLGSVETDIKPVVLGRPENQLTTNNPIINISKKKLTAALHHFGGRYCLC